MATGRRRCVLGALLVLAATGCGVVTAAPPALAHTQLTGSAPAAGTTVAGRPSTVVLRFSEPVDASTAQIAVTDPDGVSGRPPVTISGSTAAVPFPAGRLGRYLVAYRVISVDGHPVKGTIAFTVTQAATPTRPDRTPGPGAHAVSGSQQDPVPDRRWLPELAGLVVLAAAALALALRLRRRR